MENIIEYLKESKNRNFKMWYLTPEYPFESAPKTTIFGNDKFGIYIIDQFNGCEPLLITYESLYKTIELKFVPTLVLDSHITTYLVNYASQPNRLREYQTKIIREFLCYLTFTRYDYNPFFYYLEAAAKSDIGTINQYMINTSTQLIKLKTMDPLAFLEENKIVTNPDFLDMERQKFSGDTLEDIAENKVKTIINEEVVKITREGCELIYTVLLKMALIHKTHNTTILNKMIIFTEFLQETLGIFLGTEQTIALYYFSGQLDGFIPLQKGCNYKRFLKRIEATTWDILLLRYPELLLWAGDETDTTIAYICTSEKAIYQLGKTFTIEAIIGTSQTEGTPFKTTNLSSLKERLGNQLYEITTRLDEIREKRIKDRENGSQTPQITHKELIKIKRKLEKRVHQYI